MRNRKLSHFEEGQTAEWNKMKQKAKEKHLKEQAHTHTHTHCCNCYQICKTQELENGET